LDAAFEGVIDRAERDRRLADVDRERSKLTTRRVLRRITVPPDVASDDPRRVNDYLRRLFTRVVVEDMSKPARRGPSKEPLSLLFEWLEPDMPA
jgi:hypothetical protein